MLNQYAKTKGFKLGIYTKPQYMESVMHKYGFRDWDSVLAAIGHGGLKEGQVFNKLVEAYEREHKKNLTDEQVLEAASESQEKLHIAKSKSGIVVKGVHDVAVRFSKCCSPIPGDEIVGFVTRGRGITIHRTDCVNVLNMPEIDRKRLIEAEWQMPDRADSEKYEAEIQVYANNRTGLLVDISKIFTERKIDLRSINSRTNKQERATISMSFNVCSKQELNSLIEKIRQVESVLDVERTTADPINGGIFMSKLEMQQCVLGQVFTNCYFLKNKETGELLIVDPGDYAEKVFQKVSLIQGKPVGILLTHGHFDHIMAVKEVKEKYQIPVYACRQEEVMLAEPTINMTAVYGSACSIKPEVLLDDGQIFEAAGFSIQMFHTPGHTKGSCCYYIKDEGVLFSGDTLFCGSVGRTDFPGGSSAEIVRSLHKLVDTLPEDTEVFPGHDASTTIGYEKRYNPFV